MFISKMTSLFFVYMKVTMTTDIFNYVIENVMTPK